MGDEFERIWNSRSPSAFPALDFACFSPLATRHRSLHLQRFRLASNGVTPKIETLGNVTSCINWRRTEWPNGTGISQSLSSKRLNE